MAEFTDVEKQLLERVSDNRLRTSLAEIREAAEDIWFTDAPRIIQDYTDHGITHSERLAGFAARLLEANDGRKQLVAALLCFAAEILQALGVLLFLRVHRSSKAV